jgi:lathosterol oxidase
VAGVGVHNGKSVLPEVMVVWNVAAFARVALAAVKSHKAAFALFDVFAPAAFDFVVDRHETRFPFAVSLAKSALGRFVETHEAAFLFDADATALLFGSAITRARVLRLHLATREIFSCLRSRTTADENVYGFSGIGGGLRLHAFFVAFAVGLDDFFALRFVADGGETRIHVLAVFSLIEAFVIGSVWSSAHEIGKIGVRSQRQSHKKQNCKDMGFHRDRSYRREAVRQLRACEKRRDRASMVSMASLFPLSQYIWHTFSDLIVRYFWQTAGVYLIGGLILRAFLSSRRIHRPATRYEIAKEIAWSVVNIFGMAVLIGVFAVCIGFDGFLLYSDPARYGYAWLILSLPVTLLIADAYSYWFHRFLHLPWVYRHVHWIHHDARNTTAFSHGTCHPFEALFSQPVIILPFLIPLHKSVYTAYLLTINAANIYHHCGFEFFPRAVRENRVTRFIGQATDHSGHHTLFDVNYGLLFHHWDWLMKTSARRSKTQTPLVN